MRRMQGTLSDAAPAELCLRLAGQAATGALRLRGDSGEAVIHFRRGLLVSGHSPATTGEHGARLGERLVLAGAITTSALEEALSEQQDLEHPLGLGRLLVDCDLVSSRLVRLYLMEQILDTVLDTGGWTDGEYGFEPGDVDVPDGVEMSIEVHRALMEVRRRDDERARIEEQVPAPTAVHRRVEGATPPDTLAHDESAVLEAIDGEQSVGEITARLGLSYGDVSRLIYRLALQGLVESAEEDAVEEEEVRCEVCDKAFGSAAALARHCSSKPHRAALKKRRKAPAAAPVVAALDDSDASSDSSEDSPGGLANRFAAMATAD